MISSIPKERFNEMVKEMREKEKNNEFRIQDALEMMKSCAIKIYQKYPGMYKVMTSQDFVSECVLHFLEKAYLERFDGRTSKIYFIYTGMKHRAIDLLRHSNHVVKLVPDKICVTSVKDEMELSLYDVTESDEKTDPIGEMVVDEALQSLSKENPSERFADSEEFGNVVLSEYWVFRFHMLGYDRKAISKVYGVTTATVGNYLQRAQKTLADYVAK